jgi:hypothetical protein
MRITRSSFLAFLATLPVAYSARGSNDLFELQQYHVDPYIRAAVALQSLDRATAISRLHDMAQDPHSPLSVIIVSGYVLGGLPESDESYLHYCEVNCDWTDFKYTFKTDPQKRNALAKFASSNEWKNIRVTDMEFLSRQIQ